MDDGSKHKHKKVSNQERGYDVCGVIGKQGRPCQRIGVCPLHNTKTSLALGAPNKEQREEIYDAQYQLQRFPNRSNENPLMHNEGEKSSDNLKRKHEDLNGDNTSGSNSLLSELFSTNLEPWTGMDMPLSPDKLLSGEYQSHHIMEHSTISSTTTSYSSAIPNPFLPPNMPFYQPLMYQPMQHNFNSSNVQSFPSVHHHNQPQHQQNMFPNNLSNPVSHNTSNRQYAPSMQSSNYQLREHAKRPRQSDKE